MVVLQYLESNFVSSTEKLPFKKRAVAPADHLSAFTTTPHYYRLVLYIGHKRYVSCTLNRYCQRTLMLCTVSRDSSGKDLTPLRYISFQFISILVIDYIIFATENTYLFSSAHSSLFLREIRLVCFIKCHGLCLLLNSNN